jgi:sulfur carrier protein ThiS
MIAITVEVARAGRSTEQVLHLAEGTLVRAAVRAAGLSPEGCAVLIDGVSVPRDLPLRVATRLTIVPTFSGG